MQKAKRVQARTFNSDDSWVGRIVVAMGTGGEVTTSGRSRIWQPPTDVYETDTNITVKIEVAGVSEDGFVVRLQGRVLAVSGRRDNPGGKLAYQQMEISYGVFHSQVHLPCDVDGDGASADYDNGFLYIRLPKAEHQHRVRVVTVINHKS
jgi:HSP20 family molecular chaperone IbpA